VAVERRRYGRGRLDHGGQLDHHADRPRDRALPRATTTATVTVDNQKDQPVTVASISPGSSNATPGNCPAGSVTTAGLTNPAGVIDPRGTRTYTLTAKMIADPSNSCQNQTFVLPLTASLASAAG
jgi:hypothetical protein